MNRMEMLKSKGKKIVIYLMAGDPGIKETEDLIITLARSGVSLVELGIPFSDPIADGMVIQKAGERALSRGVTIKDCLEIVKRVRAKGIEIPIVAMTYYNLIYHFGPEKFVDSALKAGLDGAIIPDLPFDEEPKFYSYAKKHDFNLVYLAAPSNTRERAKKIVEKSSGFVYYILQKGVTGSAKSSIVGFELLKYLKKLSKLPVFAGFGISEPSQAKEILKIADGVIIGSAFVSLCEKYGKNKSVMLKKAEMFVKKFLNA
ncbi:MAG: tryptophan synthase subunit alpha [Candidatus Goldiibacteriota bacterium HGW-Goldbacteria-1]|jgi:tryptophan synthase alpha chain|nr:MAG: tryptophan synthase subunit alpha [Candidatus Goldiibacteriota bacterium HGW-Goldbacteria-1]